MFRRFRAQASFVATETTPSPPPPRGVRGSQQSFLLGGSAPRSKTLTLLYTIFDRKGTKGKSQKYFCYTAQILHQQHVSMFPSLQGRNEVCGIKDKKRVGWRITTHGIGISSFLRDQGSGYTIFVATDQNVSRFWNQGSESDGISDEKTFILLCLCISNFLTAQHILSVIMRPLL